MSEEKKLFAKASLDHQAGRLGSAETGYRRILEANPNFAGALHGLGLIAMQMNDAEAAQGLIGRAVAIDPDHPDFQMHLGMALHASGRPEAGIANLRRAIALAPDHGAAHYNLGQGLMQNGKEEEAVRHFERAREITPGDANTLNALATALIAIGRTNDVETLLRNALSLVPDHAYALGNLANFLLEQGRPQEAEAVARKLLRLQPDDWTALSGLARIESALEKYAEAIAHCRAALVLAPDDLETLTILGRALTNSGNLGEAAELYAGLVETYPDHAEIRGNLGVALNAVGDYGAAMVHLEKAVALDPGHANATFVRGLTRMSRGEVAAGLEDFEYRWPNPDSSARWRDLPQPLWDGRELHGEGLLIWAEQGVGDHILFANLVPLAMARGAACVLECDARLIDLLGRFFPDLHVLAEGGASPEGRPGPEIAYQVPMGGLMRALAPWPDGFTAPKRILEPDDGRRRACEKRLAAAGGEALRIGISWRSARRKIGPLKSLPLDHWGPILAGRPALFVNLQYGETEAETEEVAIATGATIFTDPEIDRFDDLEGMAALIECLDLVITTSNVTAHIAGALGKECWLALQRGPLWYWGWTGRQTLFYPSISAYRQDRAGDWVCVIDAIAKDLDAFMTRR